MAEFTGSGLYLKFGIAVYQSDFRTFEPTEEVGLVEASAGADTNRSYLTTLKDGNASLELVMQAGNTVIWPAFAPGSSGILEWGEEGTASGKPKHVCNSAIVKSRTKPISYQDVVVGRIQLQFSAAVTDSSY